MLFAFYEKDLLSLAIIVERDIEQNGLLSLAMLLGNVLGIQKNDIIKRNTLMDNDYITKGCIDE